MTGKSIPILGISLLIIAFIIPAYGCSHSNDKVSEEQFEHLQEAREKMLEAASFAVAGDATMNLDANSGSATMQLGLDGAFEKKGEGSLVEIHMTGEVQTSGEGAMELAATGYLEDRYIYFTMDGSKWYYTDLSPTPSGVLQAANLNVSQFLPESIVIFIEFAEEIQVVAENEDSIEFELIMGRDFYNFQKKSEAEQALGKSYDEFSSTEKQEVEMSVDMNVKYGKTSYFYTVDKRTGLLVEFGNTFVFDSRSLSEKIRMQGEMWFRFSDYGKDFPIHVPEEAREAEYLPPGSSIGL